MKTFICHYFSGQEERGNLSTPIDLLLVTIDMTIAIATTKYLTLLFTLCDLRSFPCFALRILTAHNLWRHFTRARARAH